MSAVSDRRIAAVLTLDGIQPPRSTWTAGAVWRIRRRLDIP